METYDVTAMTASVPVSEYLTECVDIQKFLGYCRQCPNYGKKWSCPPFSEDPINIWNAYSTLTLYARIITPHSGMELRRLMEIFRAEKDKLSAEVLELEHRIPDSRSMAAGACTACAECTRKDGTVCRHPEQVRFSIEAMGGDVARTMEKYLHHPIRWIQNGNLPEYLTLVAGLLTK